MHNHWVSETSIILNEAKRQPNILSFIYKIFNIEFNNTNTKNTFHYFSNFLLHKKWKNILNILKKNLTKIFGTKTIKDKRLYIINNNIIRINQIFVLKKEIKVKSLNDLNVLILYPLTRWQHLFCHILFIKKI